MTHITIFKYLGKIVGFLSEGHADSEDEMGSVVCNGISSLTLTTILGLRDVAHVLEKNMDIRQEDGFLYLRLKNATAFEEKPQIILQTMEVGLREIHKNYNKYMNIRIQEVNDDSF